MTDERLVQAVQALADQDTDYAEVKNGVGYNKSDTWFGHNLATLSPEEWNAEVAREAWEMLRKYRSQLAGAGIDYDAIPEPSAVIAPASWGEKTRRQMLEPLLPEFRERRAALEAARREKEERVARENTRALLLEDGYQGKIFVLVLGKQRPFGLMDAVKSLPRRRWGSTRPDLGWEAPVSRENAAGIRRILDIFGYVVASPGAPLPPSGTFLVKADAWKALRDLLGDEEEVAAPPPNPRQCRVVGQELSFSCPYDAAFVAAIKDLPRESRRFNDDKSWTVPLSDVVSVACALEIARRFNFAIDPQVEASLPGITQQAEKLQAAEEIERVETDARKAANLALQKARDAQIDLPGVAREPFGGYQRVGIKFTVDNLAPGKGVMIADDMGTGKTYQAICAVQVKQAYPALVICPASVKYNWEREWNVTVPDKTVQVLNGNSLTTGADVVVLNYDIIGKHKDALLAYGFKSMIVDEMHYCKGRKSQRSKNVKDLSKAVPFVIGLTGTPTLNRPTELEVPLQILGRINDLGGWRTFMFEHCGAFYGSFGIQTPDPRTMSPGAREDYEAKLANLNREMRARFYIRREKSEALDLPEKINTVIPVEITNRTEYERARADILAYVADLASTDREFLASIADLSDDEQKAAKAARRRDASVKAERARVLVEINKLKRIAVQGKMDALKDYVQSFIEAGRKVVVMAWHKEVVDEIARAFGCPKIAGGVDAESRQRFVDEFQNDPSCMVIACNILAAGEGITLTASSDVIFAEYAWNPGKMDQARDRCHRIGQTRNVTAHYIVGRGTIDEPIISLIDGKRRVTSSTTTGEVVEEEVTSGDIDFLLRALRGDLESDSAA